MQLTRASALLVLAYCALVDAAPTKVNSVEQQQQQQQQVQSFVKQLNEFNQLKAISDSKPNEANTLVARSDVPILDSILTALSDSGLANNVIDFVLLNPILLDVSANSFIFVLKSGLVNLTDVFIALEKSGLIIQTINLALDHPEILPGVLSIGKDFLELNGIHLFGRDDDELTVTEEEQTESTKDVPNLTKRESEFLNELLTALKDSGLASSVILHLLTTPQLAQPSAYFVNQIVQSHAITIGQILDATIQSNIIWNLFRDILADKELLNKFASIVKDRIAQGLIPKSMWDDA